uniref:Nuclear transcription factor Y subunit gamma n=2 Tax=Lutzomyia longipalpis TaxID=7200 RepID=A0A1B0CAA9_LUTLO
MSYVLTKSEDMSEDAQEATGSGAGGSGGSGDENNTANAGESEAQATLNSFWPIINEEVKRIKTVDAKNQNLPLARIKKIMKLDEDVKMISAEAPLLFAKASEIFIHELTLRAWVYTEDNKRRTLQRSDIAMAISKYDQFDFLIDIVPREEIKTIKKESEIKSTGNCEQVNQIQYYFQLAQQHQQALQGQTAAPTQIQVQTSTPVTLGGMHNNIIVTSPTGTPQSAQQPATNAMIVNNVPQQNQPLQVLQQIVTPTGEIQHIQIPLSPSQLNLIRMQGGAQQQPIIIQTTAPQQQTAQPQILQLGQPASQHQQVSAAPMFINATATTASAASSTDG